jgi:hypothetical protein
MDQYKIDRGDGVLLDATLTEWSQWLGEDPEWVKAVGGTND